MKYATAISKRRKTSGKKPKSKVSTAVMIPNHSLVAKVNYRGFAGEDLIRDYQYPQTIYNLFRHQEREKFMRFIDNLFLSSSDFESNSFSEDYSIVSAFQESIREKDYSKDGCLRWVYDHKFFSDGQDRYEAADDVSFDVRSNFCARCELARRLVELHPIAYETPEENGPKPELSTDGYTSKSWEWVSEEQVYRARKGSEGVVELSKDLFRDLLVMLQVVGGYEMMRDTACSFPCGNRRTYVMEKITNDHGMESIDYQNDIARSIREMETPREINVGGVGKVTVSIMISEINPFVTNVSSGTMNDQCFYSPNLKININSNVIHSMSISLKTADSRSFLFVCPSNPLIDYEVIQGLESFPDIEFYYPAVFYGRRGLGEVMLYSVMYLMEGAKDGEFTKVVEKEPQEFYKICKVFFDREDSESLRQRLILHKRNETMVSFPRSLKAFRNSLLGLKTMKQKQE